MKRWLVLLLVMTCLSACGRQYTHKRMAWWQSIRTRYNTLFNAQQAYESERIRQIGQSPKAYVLGHPLDIGADSADLELYQAVWSRCERAILRYSMRSSSTRRGPASHLVEHNPAMHRAWRLLGESLFYAARYHDAAQVFAHIAVLYTSDIRLQHYARLWQARCLLADGQLYMAGRIIQDLSLLPSIEDKAIQQLATLTKVEMALALRNWSEAIPLLQDYQHQRLHPEQKARAYYALALAYEGAKHLPEAEQYYQRASQYTISESLKRIYKERRLDELLPSALSTEKAEAPSRGIIHPIDTVSTTLSDTIYPIDWGRIYTSEEERIASAMPKVMDRLELNYLIRSLDYGRSELLFLVSAYNFKQHTQRNLRLELSSEPDNGYYRLIVRGFADRIGMEEYNRALNTYLSEHLGLVATLLD